ncbi:MAG: hypothetical protein AB7U82_07285 [Blastocatellales bacterium]
MGPALKSAATKNDDLAIHFVNIGDWGSPVSEQYGINFVPNFKVFDPDGRLKVEGREATAWVRSELERRAQ